MACAQVEDAAGHNCFDRRVIALARSSHFSSSDRSSRGEIDREIYAGFLGKTDGRLTSGSLIRRGGRPVA